MLVMRIKELQKLPLKPNNINSYISIGEIVFYHPYLDRILMLDDELEDNRYHNVPSYWAMKLKNDCFIFKISISEKQSLYGSKLIFIMLSFFNTLLHKFARN